MSDDEIRARCITVVRRALGCDADALTDVTRFSEDLKADSLDVIELTMSLEEEFGVQVSDDEMAGFRTFGDVVRLFSDKVPS